MTSETLNQHFKTSDSPFNCHLPAHPHRLQSSSKWLHSLRASRGFPESDHIDLDHFLSTSLNKTDSALARPPLPEPEPENNDSEAVEEEEEEVPDLISNVLSELFHMGDQSTIIHRQKSSRKQHCPRICLVSTDMDVTAPRHSHSHSHTRLYSTKVVNQAVTKKEDDHDLSAYSQTEVTVIDTSVPCWKFDKVLYRSKNVWKVGDKKGKCLMSGDSDKRLNENGTHVHKKKLKKKLKLSTSDNEEAILLSKVRDRGKIMVAANEEKQDSCCQVHEKSLCKKQIDEDSSVILIKSIPTTNKKNVSGVSNGFVKPMQR